MNTTEVKKIVKDAVTEAIIYSGSQAKLAKKCNLTQGAISKYIMGTALPTGVTARKLNEAVGKTIPLNRFAPHIFEQENV